jgi:isopenicillin-N epimerase
VFVENATQGMNVVALSLPLRAGDEVVLTDHEYGAVERIWYRRCRQVGATIRVASLPRPVESVEQLIASVLETFTIHTRLLVISHITSPTAIILPVQQLCAAAKEHNVATCIDGPHAPAQIPLNLSELGCDFYAASCHKWLSAPFGSGFLHVNSKWQSEIVTPQLSWGLLRPDKPQGWDDEFVWSGTRDPTAYLSVPAAIDFLEEVNLDLFRRRTHWLARYARERLAEFAPRRPLVADSDEWYGSMAHMPLPTVDSHQLQRQLWERYGIEVPIVDWSGNQWIRVSCHLYNTTAEVDLLVKALRELL